MKESQDACIRSYVHKTVNGRDCLGTGVHAGMVTPDYKTVNNLFRHFLSPLPPGEYHVEVFYNWDKRYGTPDLDFRFDRK